MQQNTENNFWSKVNKTDTCWEWTGALDPKYGLFRIGGKLFKAHRYSMMLAGHDPAGLFVCHTCDNPKCVNPDHLFLGTNQDNMDDKVRKKRTPKVQPNIRKLTDEQVRYARDTSRTCLAVAEEFGVCKSTISLIRRGLRYQDIN